MAETDQQSAAETSSTVEETTTPNNDCPDQQAQDGDVSAESGQTEAGAATSAKPKTKKPRSSSNKKSTEEKRRRRLQSQSECELPASSELAETTTTTTTTENIEIEPNSATSSDANSASGSPGGPKRKVSKSSTEEKRRRAKKEGDGSMNGYSSAGESNLSGSGKKKRALSRRLSHNKSMDENADVIVDPRMLSLVGQNVGNYEVGKRLGKGGASVVYVATHKDTKDQVAIKQLYLDAAAKENIQPLMEEIELMKRLDHMNIVKYIEHILTDENLFMVMEFMSKGSLGSILKECGTFPENLACMYIAQALDGLEYIHSKGIVHRDIKGDNLLTTADSILKLADFGVACVLTEAQRSSRTSFSQDRQQAGEGPDVVGTPYWMAPEVIEMKPATPASDIWSLGCTLIELLVGNPPFFELGPLSALFRIVEDRSPPLPADLSPEARDFLECCFQRDPKKRKTASELKSHNLITKYADLVPTANSTQKISLKEVRNTIRDKSRQNTTSRPSVASIFQQDVPNPASPPSSETSGELVASKCSVFVPAPDPSSVVVIAEASCSSDAPDLLTQTRSQPESQKMNSDLTLNEVETNPTSSNARSPSLLSKQPPPPPPPVASTKPTSAATPVTSQQPQIEATISRSPVKKRSLLANILIISRKEQEDRPPRRPLYKQS